MASVYVGTFAKYNSGSIKGAWLDLDSYRDHEDFIEACKELHKDENDPELMFQDYEEFPKRYYSESNISEDLWEYLALDTTDQEIVNAYFENVNSDGSFKEALEAYLGTFKSPEDWAIQHLEDTGEIDSIPKHLLYYFNYEEYARDCQLNRDIIFTDTGHVFHNH